LALSVEADRCVLPYRIIVGINYEALWEDFKLAPASGPKFENFTFTADQRSDLRPFR